MYGKGSRTVYRLKKAVGKAVYIQILAGDVVDNMCNILTNETSSIQMASHLVFGNVASSEEHELIS